MPFITFHHINFVNKFGCSSIQVLISNTKQSINKLSQIWLLQQLFQSRIFQLLLPQLFLEPLHHLLRFFQVSFQKIRIGSRRCRRRRRHNDCLCHVRRRLRRFNDETWLRYRRRRYKGCCGRFLWLDGDGGVDPDDLEGAGCRPVVDGVLRNVAGYEFSFQAGRLELWQRGELRRVSWKLTNRFNILTTKLFY